MKKTISLLLAALLVASLGILPVSASTDAPINADANLEEGLSLGDLTNNSYPQFRATQGNVNAAYNDAQGNSGNGKWGVKVIEDPEIANQMASSRIVQAKETGCATLITPCPFCKLNLENDDLEVLDLTEFLVKYGGINESQ